MNEQENNQRRLEKRSFSFNSSISSHLSDRSRRSSIANSLKSKAKVFNRTLSFFGKNKLNNDSFEDELDINIDDTQAKSTNSSNLTSNNTDFLIQPELSNLSLSSSVEDRISWNKINSYPSTLFNNPSPISKTDSINQPNTNLFSEEILSESVLQYINDLKQTGIILYKVSRKKRIAYNFKIVGNQLINWKDKYIDISWIRDVRVFDEARNYREQFNIPFEQGKYWITIIYQIPTNKLKALHCYSSTKLELIKFYQSILSLMNRKHKALEILLVPSVDEFTNFHWQKISNSENLTKKGLDLEDVSAICDKYDMFCSSKYIKQLFKESDLDKDGVLNYLEFYQFVKLLKNRKDIESIFDKIKCDSSLKDMSLAKFERFMKEIQNSTDSEYDEIINKFNIKKTVDISTFRNILEAEKTFNDTNSKEGYYDHPITSYFISSSHNTYLRGAQIADESTIESYIEVLQKGCRCVEVDVWDGENGPVVSHGMLTSSISLKNVLEVIKKYAFITTSFPLIVSFEVHCKPENQYIMIYLINEYFNGFLYKNLKDQSKVPSPNDLKGNILIKFTKRGKIYKEQTDQTEDDEAFSSDDDFSGIDMSRQDSGIKFSIAQRYKKKVDILPELLELGAIHGIKYNNFQWPESKKIEHSFSFSENRFNKMVENFITKLFMDKHNRRYFMRIYPHALRYKSSNFNNIIDFWELGAQMVATNWQTNDLGQCLNLAMFEQPYVNDKSFEWSSGYVLKPDYLLPKIKVKEMRLFYKQLNETMVSVKYNIDVLSCYILKRPLFHASLGNTTEASNEKGTTNPSSSVNNSDVEVTLEFELFTNKKNEKTLVESFQIFNAFKIEKLKGQTLFFKDNGSNPIWNTKLTFETKYPYFTFLHFKVRTKDHTCLGEVYVKLSDIKPGYRHLNLKSSKTGESIPFSKLFVSLSCI